MIKNHYHHSTKLQCTYKCILERINITSLLGNKLVIFSGIALCYGDTFIVSLMAQQVGRVVS